MTTKFSIEKLNKSHVTQNFDCGSEDLNQFLRSHALTNQRSGSSQSYVGLSDKAIVGYYTLTIGQIEYADAIELMDKGMPIYPITVIILARLAVDESWQGHKIGSGLLKDALLRSLQAVDITNARALVVHAKDETAQRFYQHFGFNHFPDDQLTLYALIKDIRKIINH